MLWRVVWWIVAAWTIMCIAAPPEESKVTIYKCCAEGEELDLDRSALVTSESCHPSKDYGNDIIHEWVPHVYNVERRTLMQGLEDHWQVKEKVIPECRRREALITIMTQPPENVPSFVLYPNASVVLTEYPTVLAAETYCLDARALLVCVEDEPASTSPPGPNLLKCCGPSAAYSKARNGCVVQPEHGAGSLPPGAADPRVFNLQMGFPVCPPGDHRVFVGQLAPRDAVLKADGSLVLERSGPSALRPHDFCVERVLHNEGEEGEPAEVTAAMAAALNAPASVIACHSRVVAGAVKSRGNAAPASDDVRFALYPVGLVLSVFFLAATLAAGCLLPGTHHVLHWRCQTAHVACLMVGDLLLAITQLSGGGLPPTLCYTIAIFMHFFFMAAFLWLNTMCWNIWWTFRDLRPASLDKTQEVRRLRFCHLYAWGIAFLIAGLGLLFDNLPDSHSNVIRPKFGLESCWFHGEMEKFFYFFIPMGLTLLANLVLFTLTARALTCGLWKQEVVKSSTERATLGRVCLKLVIVMGLTWITDIISWAAGGPNTMWYFTDFINALQGVFIFAVVGCQQQVWAAVNRLWCWYIPRAGSSTTGQHVSTYSQGLPSLGESVTHSHTHKSVPLETMC